MVDEKTSEFEGDPSITPEEARQQSEEDSAAILAEAMEVSIGHQYTCASQVTEGGYALACDCKSYEKDEMTPMQYHSWDMEAVQLIEKLEKQRRVLRTRLAKGVSLTLEEAKVQSEALTCATRWVGRFLREMDPVEPIRVHALTGTMELLALALRQLQQKMPH